MKEKVFNQIVISDYPVAAWYFIRNYPAAVNLLAHVVVSLRKMSVYIAIHVDGKEYNF